MNKINFYLFKLSFKYIFINLCIITLFVIFINIIEISRVLDKENQNLFSYIYLSFLKVPSMIYKLFPFIFLISSIVLFLNFIQSEEIIALKIAGISNFRIIFFNPIRNSFIK